MAKTKPVVAASLNVGEKLANIQMLVRSKRPKEAIAYEFMIFIMMCSGKYRERKMPSQSIRDYAMKMVRDHGLNPANLYPFVQKVEEILYGGRDPSVAAFNESLVLFNKVFEEVAGRPLPPMEIPA